MQVYASIILRGTRVDAAHRSTTYYLGSGDLELAGGRQDKRQEGIVSSVVL